jgi:1-deoxy-D-xylulose-5-phosphate reductoisomerase
MSTTMQKRNIALLGCTGSIGISSLEVIHRHGEHFQVQALAAGNNIDLLRRQIRIFSPRRVSVREAEDARRLSSEFPNCRFFHGREGLERLVELETLDTVILAIPGTDSLAATVTAIQRGMRLCLANKETMVAAGDLINAALDRSGAEILPVDSEHSAIFQALADNPREAVHRVILTASGGPFSRLPAAKFSCITPEEALAHPVWDMGQKISIDSATMMNKALEMVEARHLFRLNPHQIDILIHPQSIVHSLVEYSDSSVIAQLGLPDMKLPILYSLTYPWRLTSGYPSLDLAKISRLDFHEPDTGRFRSLGMARHVLERGGNSGAVFNAANEVAVEAFLAHRISFADIFDIVEKIMYNADFEVPDSLEEVESTILETKRKTGELIAKEF